MKGVYYRCPADQSNTSIQPPIDQRPPVLVYGGLRCSMDYNIKSLESKNVQQLTIGDLRRLYDFMARVDDFMENGPPMKEVEDSDLHLAVKKILRIK